MRRASATPKARAQLVLQYLARGGARELRQQLELLGELLPHDVPFLHEPAHVIESERHRLIAQDNAGAHALAAAGIGDPDHGRLGDQRVLV